MLLEFRLHSEGSNANPLWGIAFRHKKDVPVALDTEISKRPRQINIEFPDKKIYTFSIRMSFWNGCYEFVDARVINKKTGVLLKTIKPIKSFAIDKLGYDIKTKGACAISIEVVRKNQLLRIISFK